MLRLGNTKNFRATIHTQYSELGYNETWMWQNLDITKTCYHEGKGWNETLRYIQVHCVVAKYISCNDNERENIFYLLLIPVLWFEANNVVYRTLINYWRRKGKSTWQNLY